MIEQLVRSRPIRWLAERIPPRWLADLEYNLRPSLRESWGGPFNGQRIRQAIFKDLLRTMAFRAIIETGTYRGGTTEYMARISSLPVYSVESHPLFFHYAKRRLRSLRRTYVSLGDSRTVLTRLAADPLVPQDRVFFYLDAHWEGDLPLRDEIEIIFGSWSHPVVMVDDFEVPGDSGYGFDDYGSGRRLCPAYLDSIQHPGITSFFPSVHSNQESGERRGSVVLVRKENASVLRSITGLRRL